MGVDGPSLELAISLLMGTPITGESNGRTYIGESNGRTWKIIGLFKSVRGELKFLAKLLACKSSISTVVLSTWFVLSFSSPGTSLIPTGSKKSSVSNIHL